MDSINRKKMGRLKLTKSAINSLGYVYVDRKNLEAIESEIRTDERWKFAEWLMKSKYNFIDKYGFSFIYYDENEAYKEKSVSIKELLAEYEKEQKNED